MIGRIQLKRVIKRTAGLMSVASPFAMSRSQATATIFVYHRIADIDFVDSERDDWNVSPSVFDNQIKALSESTCIVPLMELLEKVRDGRDQERPLVCLTFDDGFANVCDNAVPILEKYQAPATLFISTAYVGSEHPMPFDGWANKNKTKIREETWRAVDWDSLERSLNTGLVTIGSHSHQHLNGMSCNKDQLREEVGLSHDTLQSRLGPEATRSYAYPYGSSRLGQVTDDYVDVVREAGYEVAVSTDLGVVGSESDIYRLPRVEAHPVDSPSVMRAKAQGSLHPYYITDWLRGARRAGAMGGAR